MGSAEFSMEFGLRGRLHLVGEVSPARIYEFLAAGDACAFSSLTETFGLAAVEAAIAGLPVVARDLDVLREVLTTRDGEAAPLFVRPDADGIAGALGNPCQAGACAKPRGGRKKASGAICAGYEALLLPDRFGTAAMPSITSSDPERLSV